MPIRFYVDADLLGLAKLLVTVRADVTFPGDPGGTGIDGYPRPACSVQPGAKDPVWIPIVAAEGWVIITRDRRIQSKPAERQAVIEHSAKLIRLDPRHALSKWGQLEIVVSQWRRMEDRVDTPGPWLFVATRSGLRSETLD
ncbi:MAG: hypothetical protein ACRD1G_17040 [Acidimicrobiales bacterium]